jgi:hypothetical protein
VALSHDSDACLLWPFSTRGGRRPQDAYPALGGCYAHVFLCELVYGPKPTPLHEVEHICGVKLCMNVRHIQWELHRENCARRTAHGTQTVGEQHGMAKLTERQVRKILASKKMGIELAAEFNVSPPMICRIRKRKAWKHLLMRSSGKIGPSWGTLKKEGA